MNTNEHPNAALITLRSAHSAIETAKRLTSLLKQKQIQLFAHIDHSAAAKSAGLSLRPTQVLIFGNPQAGTPLMQSQRTIALDLPLKVLVWEDDHGKIWLTYRPHGMLAAESHLAGHDETVATLDNGLAALARAATSAA
jgi:uncharacterized protein (DUF302 family)